MLNTLTTRDKQFRNPLETYPPDTFMVYSSQLNLAQLIHDADFGIKKMVKDPKLRIGRSSLLPSSSTHTVAANPWPCQMDSVRKSEIVFLSMNPVMRSPSSYHEVSTPVSLWFTHPKTNFTRLIQAWCMLLSWQKPYNMKIAEPCRRQAWRIYLEPARPLWNLWPWWRTLWSGRTGS